MNPTKHLNLLLIGNHFTDSGHNQNAWQDLAYHLRAAGYGVRTTSGQKNKFLRLVDMLLTIWRRRKDYQIAQVDVFSGPAFTWALLSARLLRRIHKPFILTLHGGNLPDFSQMHREQVKWLFNQASVVTAPSRYLLEAMRPYRDDIILIPNALHLAQYPYIERISPRPVLIWLRAFHEIYNPSLAIQVVDKLHKEFPAIRLIMVGPDKGDGSLQKAQRLADQLGLAGLVAFAGGVGKADVPTWLNKGDIFLNTTNFDNTPISVMEAMACGLCVVSTNVGGIPYLLTDEADALVIPPESPEAMAAAIRRILTEPGFARALSANARRKAELFDWAVVLPKWQQLFSEVSEKGSA